MSGAKVASKLELSTLVESLGSESGTEVEFYTFLSDGSVEIKLEGYSWVSEKGASKPRVAMEAELTVMGADAVET